MDNEKRYLTVQELETYIGFRRQHIYRLVERREIPFARIGTKMVRFDRTKIDDWMDRQQVKPVKQQPRFFLESHRDPPKVTNEVS